MESTVVIDGNELHAWLETVADRDSDMASVAVSLAYRRLKSTARSCVEGICHDHPSVLPPSLFEDDAFKPFNSHC